MLDSNTQLYLDPCGFVVAGDNIEWKYLSVLAH